MSPGPEIATDMIAPGAFNQCPRCGTTTIISTLFCSELACYFSYNSYDPEQGYAYYSGKWFVDVRIKDGQSMIYRTHVSGSKVVLDHIIPIDATTDDIEKILLLV